MPIRTECSSCGKKLRIRDEYMGRKVKCPACGNTFLAEAVEESTAITAEAPPSAPAKKAKDKVAAKPMTKKPPPEEDDDEEIEDRPVKRGKKSRKAERKLNPLWLGIAAAVLLVVLLVGGYFLFFSGPSKKTGVVAQKGNQGRNVVQANVTLADLVPGDSWFFLSASGDLPAVPGLEALAQMAKGAEDEFQKSLGFPMADVERWSAFSLGEYAQFKNNPFPPVAVVVQTKKPMQQQAVTAAIAKGDLGKQAKVKTEFPSDQMLLVMPVASQGAYKAKKGKRGRRASSSGR